MSTVLQWIGLAVVGIVGLAVAIAIFRLLWIAVSRQWTKYAVHGDALELLIREVCGSGPLRPGEGRRLRRGQVTLRLRSDSLRERIGDAHRLAKSASEKADRLGKRIAELESYRPANIENPEDLR